MALAQAQYLRIHDAAGATYHRWQNYYLNAVTWDGQLWQHIPFTAEGLTDGINGEESDISIQAPAGAAVVRAFEQAISAGYMVELLLYQFDTIYGNDMPQSSQVLVGTCVGQVVSGSAALESMTINVGAALSPIGAQIPPRKFTTGIMGQGCRL